MTKEQIEELTRELKAQAIVAGRAAGGVLNMVEAVRVDYPRKSGEIAARHRVDFYVIGQRVSRELAANYLKPSVSE